jgi:hypothetical protein
VKKYKFLEYTRSIRVSRFNLPCAAICLLAASALNWFVVHYQTRVIALHQAIVSWLILWTGASQTRYRYDAFTGVPSTPQNAYVGNMVGIPGYRDHPGLLAMVFIIVALLLIGIYVWASLGRMLTGLLLVLLTGSLLNLLAGNGAAADVAIFFRIWLKFEFTVWILVPWIMALLVAFISPRWWASLFWILIPAVYAVVWSAVRLAFCAVVLHLTGALLMVPLWFSVGALSDLLYLCVFFSLAVYHAGWLHSFGKT